MQPLQPLAAWGARADEGQLTRAYQAAYHRCGQRWWSAARASTSPLLTTPCPTNHPLLVLPLVLPLLVLPPWHLPSFLSITLLNIKRGLREQVRGRLTTAVCSLTGIRSLVSRCHCRQRPQSFPSLGPGRTAPFRQSAGRQKDTEQRQTDAIASPFPGHIRVPSPRPNPDRI